MINVLDAKSGIHPLRIAHYKKVIVKVKIINPLRN